MICTNNFFKHIELILKFVDHAVKTAEQATASGDEKRKAAIAMVIQLAKAIGLDLTPFENLIGKMVDTAVFAYNILHIFEHHSDKKA